MSSSLPETLSDVFNTKVKELDRIHRQFNRQREELYAAAASKGSVAEKVSELVRGAARLKGFPNDANQKKPAVGGDHQSRASHINARKYWLQHGVDPSFSDEMLNRVADGLTAEIDLVHSKNQHALFFSQLLSEWLTESNQHDSGDDKADDNGREEMYKQRETWESIVFQEHEVDVVSINQYLNALFIESSTVSARAIEGVRERFEEYGTAFSQLEQFDNHSLEVTGRALLKSGQLTEEKTNTLTDLLNNKDVSQEVCDVLNMRLANLDNWDWSLDAVPLEMRRQLNGKYRVYMDSDLLDALLVEFVGRKWSVLFRDEVRGFIRTDAWSTKQTNRLSNVDIVRREHYLNEGRAILNRNSIAVKRRDMYATDYFMQMLPESFHDVADHYNTEDDDESDIDSVTSEPQKKNQPHNTLIHLMLTEAIISTTIHKEFSVVCSDFKWFGPSLPHATIRAVLEFFGIPDVWLDFFTRFLEVPVKFALDGDNGNVTRRKCGVPMNHALSDFFGEVILFCLDYAVDKYGHGTILYRLHDDFWIWGTQSDVNSSWSAVLNFVNVFGLEINEEKSGSAQVGEKSDDNDSTATTLPQGDVKWGMLKFDPAKCCFVIDQSLVDEHIDEFKLQLASRHSILSWIKAYNSYMAFFLRNCGQPAVCFEEEHIDMVLQTISKVETAIFPDFGSCIKYLQHVISNKFNVSDMPEGFFYFPFREGGVELLNPYIKLLTMKDGLDKTVTELVDDALSKEKAEYQRLKRQYEESGGRHSDRSDIIDADEFMPFEEYIRFREQKSTSFGTLYNQLMAAPTQRTVWATQPHQDIEDPYWLWIYQLYTPKVEEKFGSSALLQEGSASLGVLKFLNSGKVKWKA
ncbi:hypothetical protein TRICI_006833 [Trichomonascus ciferrii]|uniref:Reverse transcriptase domain-containing protein n=1 Tax=Trichomonascus ciferrii TaxID=44093 RepID=A0A642UJS6_9ASCO|nr:hypothetical protein TRICI_006833 [Trichomonascus ciferrii]